MRRALCLLPAAMLLLACTEHGDAVLGAPGVEVVPHYAATVDVKDSAVEVTSLKEYGEGGVSLKGQWDLTEYNRLRFKVTNLEPLEHLSLVASLCNEKQEKIPWRSTVFAGILSERFHVKPGETLTLTLWLPEAVAHPEIDSLFTTMQNTPYSCGRFSYNVDWSDIREIRFNQRWNKANNHFRISDVELLKGEKQKGPEYLSYSEDEFFPFIDKYGQFKYRDWPGKIHSDEELAAARVSEEADLAAHPGPDNWDKWGGWADGPQLEATGRFRTEKIEGKWWMVDPDGHLFWSHGVLRISPGNAVTPLSAPGLADRRKFFEELPAKDDPELGHFYETFDPLLGSYYAARGIDDHFDFSSANCYRKYGPDYMTVYGDLCHRRLRSWAMNTMANATEPSITSMGRTPWCDRFEIVSKPMSTSAKILWWSLPDPFDPSFKAEIDRQLLAREKELKDPWCIGFFVDNEHAWGDSTHVTECALDAPDGAAVKQALRAWLKEKYGKGIPYDAMTKEDKIAFNDVVIEKYYSTIREEFDRLAPGLLYMGCRFGGHPQNPRVIEIGAKYCDLLSYNIYKYNLDCFTLPEGIDKPVLIGEFHFGAMDRGPFHPGQVWTADQAERGECYKDYVRSALEHPNFVGTHWHQFSDQATTGRFDGEDFQVGFTDVCDTPYKETIEAAREIGAKMYQIRWGK